MIHRLLPSTIVFDLGLPKPEVKDMMKSDPEGTDGY